MDEWSTASLNYPLTIGDHVWTDTRARTELQLDTAVLRVAPATERSVLNLDDHVAQIRLTQGTVSVRVRAVDVGDTMEVDTPAGAVSLLESASQSPGAQAPGGAAPVEPAAPPANAQLIQRFAQERAELQQRPQQETKPLNEKQRQEHEAMVKRQHEERRSKGKGGA